MLGVNIIPIKLDAACYLIIVRSGEQVMEVELCQLAVGYIKTSVMHTGKEPFLLQQVYLLVLYLCLLFIPIQLDYLLALKTLELIM